MEGQTFVKELLASNDRLLAGIDTLGSSLPETKAPELVTLLKVALANEINVADLAAHWIPTTPEWEIKVALARQAGDEARHFQTIAKRLEELGISLEHFTPPATNPLFDYLKGLESSVERISAGMVALESIAYRVNESFLQYCESHGDTKTAEIYRRYIQPDELMHHERGRMLLEKYATTPAAQEKARAAAQKTLEIARTLRSAAALRLGISCFPGC